MHFKTPHFGQNMGYKARVGAAVFLTGTFLLTSGISIKVYSQNNKTKGGDSTLLMQTGPGFIETKKDTSKTMDTVPKIVVPDVKTLEHYNPFPNLLTDSMFINKNKKLQTFRELWSGLEDSCTPFGLSQKVIDSYSPQDKKELMLRWEIAKNELRVAFMSDKGVTPANALKLPTEEVKKLLENWDNMKDAVKMLHEKRPLIPIKN